VVDQPVNRGHGGHGVLEDAVPLREDEVGRDQDAAPLVAPGQQGKEHLHFVAVMLHVADVIQDQAGEALELGQLLREPQISLLPKIIYDRAETCWLSNVPWLRHRCSRLSKITALMWETEQSVGRDVRVEVLIRDAAY
jgi:hypothetical protein